MKKSLIPLLFGRKRPMWSFYNDFTTGVLDSRFAFSRSSPAWQFNSAGILVQAAANAPRFAFDPLTLAPRGLQFEAEARTNVCVSGAAGATVGSPGAMPPNWTLSSSLGLQNGVTRSIVGAGTEQGIPYFDIRFQGIFVAAENPTIGPLPGATGNTASPGQVWSTSGWWKVIAGTLPPPTSSGIAGYRVRFGSPGLLSQLGDSDVPRTDWVQRGRAATAPAGTTVAGTDWVWLFAAGATVDFTLRIGSMQFELGSAPSSYIPTSGAAVTRAADVCTMTGANFSSWYAGAAECTLFAETMLPFAPGASSFPKVIRMFNAGFTSNISNQFYGASLIAMGEVVTSGVNQGGVTVACSAGVFNKTAFRAANNNMRLSANGALSGIDSAATIDVMTRMYIGEAGFMGYIKAVGVATRGMTDAELISTTS